MVRFVKNEEIYEQFILPHTLATSKFLWIGTADIKDMHIRSGRSYVPFLKSISDIIQNGAEVRMLHAKEPGVRFRKDFDRFPALVDSSRFDRLMCPRVHFKCMIVDGKIAYIGSANLTGAGMGARNKDSRNFEAGIITDEAALIEPMMEMFDEVFTGSRCAKCRLRDRCPDPID